MKRLFVIILTGAMLLCLADCQDSSVSDMTPGQSRTDHSGLEIQIKGLHREEASEAALLVVWNNQTEYDVVYGASYVIERLEKETWVSCAKQEEVFFDAIAYELKAGQTEQVTYDLAYTYDVSVPGTYRFKTECYVYDNAEQSTKCQLVAEFTVGNIKWPEDSKKTAVGVEWHAQYIRTDGYQDGAKFPRVQIIGSEQELNDYIASNVIFDLERKEKVYYDTTMGFADACDRYDAAFFEKNYLIFVLLEEGSGSIRHEVHGVERTPDEKISISINRKLPEVGTCDMAEWHIILELSRDVLVEKTGDVLVYLDGDLCWNGSTVEPPKPETVRKKPPEGTLRTPEGDVTLSPAGYEWTVQNNDGTAAVVTIADQASRPLPQDSLKPVAIDSKYAETVYAPVPDKDIYASTNSLGYLLKLNWEVSPASVTYTCWPETVWQEGSTPEEAVVSQDLAFYAKPGGYIYEIVATWENTGVGYYGSANYYVYITG